MKCFIGIGSNLGDRKFHLERAAKELKEFSKFFRATPLVQTKALVPDGAPDHWQKPFLNGGIEIDWNGTPRELLNLLKAIEKRLGRNDAPRWAPRIIDLDLLTFGEERLEETELKIPHAGIWDRQFVLSPLKHLYPSLKLFGKNQSILERSRQLSNPSPLWMGILNLTPDSFSDGGQLSKQENLELKINLLEGECVQIIDLGAESTRPGALPISHHDEWERLLPTLAWLQKRLQSSLIRPWISVDTYHVETARGALSYGVDIINDVSGLASPEMITLLKENSCQYVLMHHLGVLCDDPIATIKEWALTQLERLKTAGISLDRIMFDPGLGFGKSASQSISIIKRIDEFMDLPVRILVGHSRKSFLSSSIQRPPQDREWESLGASLQLAERGVDILRVHEPHSHARAHFQFQESNR